jgi:hypothetical protein
MKAAFNTALSNVVMAMFPVVDRLQQASATHTIQSLTTQLGQQTEVDNLVTAFTNTYDYASHPLISAQLPKLAEQVLAMPSAPGTTMQHRVTALHNVLRSLAGNSLTGDAGGANAAFVPGTNTDMSTLFGGVGTK